MPDYKHRRIELAPRRHADGTWHCQYCIIEFRPTCWGYHTGCPDGGFASREAAAAEALQEAKHFVDSLEPPAPVLLSESSSIVRAYADRMRKLTVSFVQSLVGIDTLVPRRVSSLLNWRKY